MLTREESFRVQNLGRQADTKYGSVCVMWKRDRTESCTLLRPVGLMTLQQDNSKKHEIWRSVGNTRTIQT